MGKNSYLRNNRVAQVCVRKLESGRPAGTRATQPDSGFAGAHLFRAEWRQQQGQEAAVRGSSQNLAHHKRKATTDPPPRSRFGRVVGLEGRKGPALCCTGNVEDDDGTGCISEVAWNQRSKSFLSSRVPELESNVSVINVQGLS